MTQEDKELLLKDLCTRLPYKTMVKCNTDGHHEFDEELTEMHIMNFYQFDTKPYLRPMSNMTEEEFFEYFDIKYNKVTCSDKWECIDVGKFHNIGIIPIEDYLDWLNAHYFDYRGLIPMGLALEAPEGMYNIK